MDYFFQIWIQDKYFFEIIYFGASTFNPNCSPVANLSLKNTRTLEVHFSMPLVYYCTYNSMDQPNSTYLPKS